MSDTFRSRPALVAVAAVMATGLYVGEARASGECAKYGKPTYQADRLVKIGGDTFRSRVYVMGDMEREEIDHGGGRTEVIIVARGEVLSFFPEAKVGMRRSVAAGGRPKTPEGSIRAREERSGSNSRIILEARTDDGSWTVVNEVTCRSDGALLGRRSTVPLNGKMVPSEMIQQIRGGSVDRSMFTAPSGISFKR